jgi:WD40 repeat protein
LSFVFARPHSHTHSLSLSLGLYDALAVCYRLHQTSNSSLHASFGATAHKLLRRHGSLVTALSFSPSALPTLSLFSGSEDGLLCEWDLARKKCLSAQSEHQSAVTAIAAVDLQGWYWGCVPSLSFTSSSPLLSYSFSLSRRRSSSVFWGQGQRDHRLAATGQGEEAAGRASHQGLRRRHSAVSH